MSLERKGAPGPQVRFGRASAIPTRNSTPKPDEPRESGSETAPPDRLGRENRALVHFRQIAQEILKCELAERVGVFSEDSHKSNKDKSLARNPPLFNQLRVCRPLLTFARVRRLLRHLKTMRHSNASLAHRPRGFGVRISFEFHAGRVGFGWSLGGAQALRENSSDIGSDYVFWRIGDSKRPGGLD